METFEFYLLAIICVLLGIWMERICSLASAAGEKGFAMFVQVYIMVAFVMAAIGLAILGIAQ